MMNSSDERITLSGNFHAGWGLRIAPKSVSGTPRSGAVRFCGSLHDSFMTNSILPIDIFVVDDERIIAQTLGIILRQAGYGVSVFHDPCTARQQLNVSPRLVIVDQHMPGLSGCELASVVFSETPQTKVLLFSASLSPGDVEWQALQTSAGEAKLLAKPLYPAQLLSCVQDMIGIPSAA